jgi:trimethylamine--corrinoid protein Co-methyltransferase
MACPEFAILKVAMAQMGHFLGLPVRMPGMLRDSKMLDAQAGFETGMVGTACALTADLIDAMQLDSDLLVDFADLVFCNECMGALKRLSEQVTVNEETLALDVLGEVGHGGSFLGHDHTLRLFRKELWQPRLMERRNWEKWKREGGLSMAEVASKRMMEILEAEPRDRLSPEVEAEIDLVVKKAEKDYTNKI